MRAEQSGRCCAVMRLSPGFLLGARLDDVRVLEDGPEVRADVPPVDEGVYEEILGPGRDLDEAGEALRVPWNDGMMAGGRDGREELTSWVTSEDEPAFAAKAEARRCGRNKVRRCCLRARSDVTATVCMCSAGEAAPARLEGPDVVRLEIDCDRRLLCQQFAQILQQRVRERESLG